MLIRYLSRIGRRLRLQTLRNTTHNSWVTGFSSSKPKMVNISQNVCYMVLNTSVNHNISRKIKILFQTYDPPLVQLKTGLLLPSSPIPSPPLPPSSFHSAAPSQFYFDPVNFFQPASVSFQLFFFCLCLSFPLLPDIWLGSLPHTKTNAMTSLHCNVPERQRETAEGRIR